MTSREIYKRFDLSKTVIQLLKHDWTSMIGELNTEISNSERIHISIGTNPEARDASRHHVKYIKIPKEINEVINFPSTFQAFIGKDEIKSNKLILLPLIIELQNQGRLERTDVEIFINKE